MSVSTSWQLSQTARQHMEAIGVDAREVLAVLEQPDVRVRVSASTQRLTGYGLTAIVENTIVRAIYLDGADSTNWEDWAYERALMRDGANVPILVPQDEPDTESDLWIKSESAHFSNRRARVRKPKPKEAPVKTKHVLDDIHPALRDTIIAQVEGDFSRLIVHSPTNVEIRPAP